MKKREFIPYGIAMLVMLLGVFYDYAFTNFLYDPSSLFGNFFARFALLPIQSMLVIMFVMLFRLKGHIVFLLIGELASFYVVQDTLRYWISPINTFEMRIVMLILSILFLCTILIIIYKCPIEWVKTNMSFFIFFSVVLVSTTVLTTIMKVGWGRVRYLDISNTNPFSAWYMPNGYNGNTSFPSGHTSAFAVILCLLQRKHNRYEKVPSIRYILVALFIIAMAMSRLVMGAHYMSDTAMGFMIAYSCYLVFRRMYQKEVFS